VNDSDLSRPNKKTKESLRIDREKETGRRPTPVVEVQICQNKYGRKVLPGKLIALIDSGSSHSLLMRSYANHLSHKFIKEQSSYSTFSGKLETNHKVEVNFMLSGNSTSTTICHGVDLIEDDQDFGYEIL